MPEGDTIHTLAGVMRPQLVGHIVRDIWSPALAINSLVGEKVSSVEAKGKHLFLNIGSGCVRSHLGMYGTWHRYALGEPWKKPRLQASLVLSTTHVTFVCFNASKVEYLRDGGARKQAMLRHLGPDLLGASFDAPAVVARAQRLLPAHTPLVDILLDQSVACGIGNVYKSELAFLFRIAPMTPLASIDADVFARLYAQARVLLSKNLSGGPRRTRFSGADNSARHWVYRRAHEPCFRCGSAIRSERLGRNSRSTYWCPNCQQLPI